MNYNIGTLLPKLLAELRSPDPLPNFVFVRMYTCTDPSRDACKLNRGKIRPRTCQCLQMKRSTKRACRQEHTCCSAGSQLTPAFALLPRRQELLAWQYSCKICSMWANDHRLADFGFLYTFSIRLSHTVVIT